MMRNILLFVFICVMSSTMAQSGGHVIRIETRPGASRILVNLVQGKNSLEIYGLEEGAAYRCKWVPTTPDAQATFTDIQHRHFTVSSARVTFELESNRAQTGYISLAPVRSAERTPPRAQSRMNVIQPQSGVSLEDLIRDILIGGDCFEVDNISLIGNPNAVGAFSNGASSIGMDEGVVMCTGNIDVIQGPNDLSDAGAALDIFPGNDPDLSLTSELDLYDVSGIEFDFRPTADTVQFRYVFASEEYCEYVLSEFNDRFGFFIAGPGINGPFSNNAINIAQIPNTTDNVSINSVNSVTNSAYYVDNVPVDQVQFGDFDCEEDLMNPGVAEEYIQFDGFTVVLTAQAVVVPCEVYRIRLVVADQTDGSYDSGVFLEANSFGGSVVEVLIEYADTSDTYATENCEEAFITFTRQGDSDLSEEVEINYDVDASSTATAGVDYEALPNPIIIPAGLESITVPVQIFSDDLDEGSEFIVFNVRNSCSCDDDQVSFEIRDYSPMEISSQDVVTCEAANFTVQAAADGGIAPYMYQWSSGQTTSSFDTSLTAPASFDLTVTDRCGLTIETTVDVQIESNTSIIFDANDTTLCEDAIGELVVPIVFDGDPPIDVRVLRDGTPYVDLQLAEAVTPMPIDDIGLYTIEVLTETDCFTESDDQLLIQATRLDVDLISAIEVQRGTPVMLTPTSNRTPDEISRFGWTPPLYLDDPSLWSPTSTPIEDISYQLEVVDIFGCMDTAIVNVTVFDNEFVYIPNAFSPNNDGVNDVFRIYTPDQDATIVSFSIYNRWGGKVFEVTNVSPDATQAGWDGTSSDDELNSDVFSYHLELEFSTGNSTQISGEVYLIK